MSMSSAPNQPPVGDGALDHALALAACGLRVLPIRRGGKHPPMSSWQHAATTDPKTIRNWWTGLYKDCGIGIAMGRQPDGRCLVAIDVDEHDPAASGSDTLADLEDQHGKLPDTVRSITGAGGAHVILEVPTEIGNGAAGQVGPGIDVRGQGGQIVVAPTVHPNGNRYAWEDGCEPWTIPIAEAPGWLLERITPSPTPPNLESTPNNPSQGDTPADRLRAGWDWPVELAKRGWQHARSERNGDTHWTRPGKDPREGTSAVLHAPDGPFVVFTTDATAAALWKAGKAGNGNVSLSPIQFLAAYEHGGDISAAARAINGPPIDYGPQGTVIEPDVEPSMLIDWAVFWSVDRQEVEWLAEPVIPAKRSVAIFAPGGTGKSLLALWIAVGLATGRRLFGPPQEPVDVLYLDYEMTEDDLAERLEAMGYGPDTDLSHLHYALLPSLPGLDQPEGGKAVVELARDVGAQLVIIDTFGRAVHGDENEADTVRAWYRWTGLHLKAEGRAFARIDHAGKDIEKGQRGTSAKNDDVDVVWRLARQDADTFQLVAKKRRMGWVPETVNIVMSEEPVLDYSLASGPSYPAGTNDVIRELEAIGVPPSASRRAACEALRAAGIGRKATLVNAAQKARRAGDGSQLVTVIRGGDHLHPAVEAVIDAVRKPGTTAGNHSDADSPGTTTGTNTRPTSDQGEPLREPPGTTTSGIGGNHGSPLKGNRGHMPVPEHDGWHDPETENT